jgi:putative oxidoreductase
MRMHYPAAARTTHNVLRIVVGFLFIAHGTQKLLGWFGGIPPQHSAAPIASQMGVAGVLESCGAILIIIGLFTRPVAFILCGEMAVAYFQVHFPRGFWPLQNMGEPAVLYCFLFLFFAFNGAGSFSVDAWRARSASERAAHEHPARVAKNNRAA